MLETSHNQPGGQPRRKRRGRRTVAAVAAAVCLLAAVCGITYAYFSAKDKVVNELKTSDLDFVIEEPSWQEPDTPVRPGDVVPKDPQVVNTGIMDFVVRIKIEEVWTPKQGQQDEILTNPDYVRYFAANQGGEGEGQAFTATQLLGILQADREKAEQNKNFALRRNLTPNPTNPNTEYWDPNSSKGWYRGKVAADGTPSEWLYYNQIVPPAQRTEPVFRAVTIQRAEEYLNRNDYATDEAYEQAAAQYNARLAKYDLDIYIYAETVQAEPFAWKSAWGDDLPDGWADTWGGTGS